MRCSRYLSKSFSNLICLQPIGRNLLVLSLLLITIATLPAFAQSRRYNPPRGGSAPHASGMGGPRSGSCTGLSNAPFTALAPLSHTGQTADTYPTVALYVPDSQPLTIDFRIYRYTSATQLQPQPVYQTELKSSAGMMAVTLPPTEPPLTVGERYFWQAALICDPNHGSEDLIVGATMQIVENSIPESERWYDLLQSAAPSDVAALLLNLATLEQASSNVEVRQQGHNLRQVIDSES